MPQAHSRGRLCHIFRGGTANPRDYEQAALPRSAPAYSWLSHEELRSTTQKMAEAIATEKWADGVTFAIGLLTRIAG